MREGDLENRVCNAKARIGESLILGARRRRFQKRGTLASCTSLIAKQG